MTQTFDNRQLAAVFDQLSDLMEIDGANAFKIRAYRRVAQALENLPEPAAELLANKTLAKVPGVGAGSIQRIKELLETGDCEDLRALKEKLPAGLLDLLRVSGLGPKTVGLIYQELGIDSVDALETAAQAGQLAALPRMGKKSEEKILKAIEAYRRHTGRLPLGRALPIGQNIVNALRQLPSKPRVALAGSVRRRRETIGDLDILVSGDSPENIMGCFKSLPQVEQVLVQGNTKCSVLITGGTQVDLRLVNDESFGAALHYFTGSQQHNIAIRDLAKKRGLRVNEYGVFTQGADLSIAGATEEEVFAALDLAYIPPELREDQGEIEAAKKGQLPVLVTAQDLRGDLHMHTVYSDGVGTAEDMARRAIELGLDYIAITDHSKSLTIANGIDEVKLAEQTLMLRDLEAALGGIRLLSGIEVDILADGSLDLTLECLKGLDWVVASVHSHFNMDRETMTARIIRAMETGVVDCIGHPTGRLLGERDPYPHNMEALVEAAKKYDVALEANAHPSRMDLNAQHCQLAREAGVSVVINTDAHDPRHLGQWDYGVYTARRGWLSAAEVLNCQSVDILSERRQNR